MIKYISERGRWETELFISEVLLDMVNFKEENLKRAKEKEEEWGRKGEQNERVDIYERHFRRKDDEWE